MRWQVFFMGGVAVFAQASVCAGQCVRTGNRYSTHSSVYTSLPLALRNGRGPSSNAYLGEQYVRVLLHLALVIVLELVSRIRHGFQTSLFRSSNSCRREYSLPWKRV
jgi:hypothetical protein